MFDAKIIQKDFPILSRKVNGNRLVYLDNAATTQKPRQVIDGIKYFYENANANPLRSVHSLSEESTKLFNSAREKVASLINAAPEEIVFVRNTTEAINLVSFTFPLNKGDTVSTTYLEHHSNFLPWLRLKSNGVKVDIVDIDANTDLDMGYYENLPQGTKLVAFTQKSNVTGTITDAAVISKLAHEKNAAVLIDAAQSIPSMPVDVKKIGADFLAFSGHKMLGPMGVGVLYINKDSPVKLSPFLTGGEMIKDVRLDRVVYENAPTLFEAGTQNVEGAYGLGLAIDYLNSLGLKDIDRYERSLTDYLYESAKDIKNLTINIYKII